MTQMSAHLFNSDKGLQRLLGPLYGCLNSSCFVDCPAGSDTKVFSH